MLDSISIATTGLQGFSDGLKVISNNVANMNTPGFKGAELRFGDAFHQAGGGPETDGGEAPEYGTGVNTLGTFVNFAAGQTTSTGNPLDLAIDGNGYFMTRAADGTVSYTRVGQFDFDAGGTLIVRGTTDQVLGYDSAGKLGTLTLDGLRTNPPKATSKVSLGGNLVSTDTSSAVDGVKLIDATGAEHDLNFTFAAKSDNSGGYTVSMVDGANTTTVGDIGFLGGQPDPSSDTLTLNYTPAGGSAFAVTLDFSGMTSLAIGSSSSVSVVSADGQVAGTLSSESFDSTGTLKLQYSNGQTASGGQLALANFEYQGDLHQASNGNFTADQPGQAQIGRPGSAALGTIVSSEVEGSNVDLSTEFSNLIVMQRGYQAASEVVTTANDMLQNLFDMRADR